MFDLGWSEILVIAVVLVVVVGPKDLPGMLRTFGRVMKQFRSMAGDFRRQFDDALKEAELDDVRKGIDDVRSLDPRHSIREAMNPMKAIGDEIRSSLNSATASPEPKVPSASDRPKTEGDPVKNGATGAEPAKGEAKPAPAGPASAESAASDSKLSDNGGEPAHDAKANGVAKARDVA
ncbi:twin-arginine translocase subunit TatB [Jiella sp. 40Bstr34]|uniref:Sec-independent protein translocase protein TatB n=1 Tax=Jiella pacifica TaxID=2696469 RepID=A0A6N9T5A0_9HYPH|nr:Sec-independent protein translocase protein TatB [Jiella pacifica]NDW06557.1 twin-arginine translocase subunit TatB [Jiella pacifica]